MTTSQFAYFILETEYDARGYIPCIAVKGEQGYRKTNWHWDCDLATAEKLADKKNAKLGLSKKDSIKIVLSTMQG